jgi:peroxiredoxin
MLKAFYVIVVLLLLPMACTSRKEEKAKIPEKAEIAVNEYPDLVLTLENGDQVSTKKLEGKNVFVLFQPECDHCQEEAIEIEQRLDDFKDYTLYFISSSPMAQIVKFAKDYKLDNKQKVKFASTSTEGVLNHYGPIQTPSVYIYSEGKLLKSFNGQTGVQNIINSL